MFEDRAYILSRREAAGGRGINASSVIHSFGGETLAIATSGGKTGERLEQFLGGLGFPYLIVRIRNPIRTNLAITDRQGLTVKLNEVGPALSERELARLEKAVIGVLDRAAWLLLCGSIPPGTPSAILAVSA